MGVRDGLREPREYVAVLAAAGFDHGEHPVDKATAGCRLSPEGKLAPDHRVPQRLLGGVVGRFDAFDFHEGPQARTIFPEFFAEAVGQLVEVTAQQVTLDLLTDRLHASLKS